MKKNLPEKLWQTAWHLLFLELAIITFVLWVLAEVFGGFKPSFLAVLYFTAALGVFAILLLAFEAVKSLKEQQEKIAQINETLASNKSLFEQISHGVRLSEAAKTITHRDTDRQQLRASVMEKLHQQDFEATYAMIEDIARRNEYKQFAIELKETADKYRDATDLERISQIISYIDRLLEQYQWTTASVQIERLLAVYPDSDKAKAMQHKLVEKKEQRKRELLAAWDQAVKKADTDYSLMVLRELDLYLTPSEGLALQEAASEVFKTKLHNLGVQFSLAVSDKHWEKALETAQEIIRDFPNSKIADEIRNKLAILRELAKK
jgi:tetratricopeptide (TPR) repeat protein